MYTSIRHYTFKGSIDKKSLDDYIGRIESTFVPGVQAIPGFHSYYLVKLRENELVGIGTFEDKSGADASSRWAAEFVKSDAIKDRINAPDITEGELRISREAAVTATPASSSG
jgi:uncharacterized protein YciI